MPWDWPLRARARLLRARPAGSLTGMAARLRRSIAWYDGHLKASPIRTKVATSVSILTVADVIRQGLELRRGDDSAGLDYARTGRMSIWGCTGHPLTIHYWMMMMERWQGSLPLTAPKGQIVKMAARKVAIDQFTASPVFLGAFLCWSTLLEGKGIDGCRQKLRDDWWTMIKFGWSTWFVGHFISFAVVPVHWRVLYINIVSIGFGTVLSQVANLPPPGSSNDAEGHQAVLTPLDMLYRQVRGPDAMFWSVEGATVAVGAAWLAAAASIARNRAAIGPVGLVCSGVGMSMYAFEATAVLFPPPKLVVEDSKRTQ
eukprot:COSAG05_NODE_261_length_12717_cov_4.824061_3_plen_314_part_00